MEFIRVFSAGFGLAIKRKRAWPQQVQTQAAIHNIWKQHETTAKHKQEKPKQKASKSKTISQSANRSKGRGTAKSRSRNKSRSNSNSRSESKNKAPKELHEL